MEAKAKKIKESETMKENVRFGSVWKDLKGSFILERKRKRRRF